MTDRSGGPAPRFIERCQTTGAVAHARPPSLIPLMVSWSIVVWLCALPMIVATWTIWDQGGRVAELCGVAVWNIIVLAFDARMMRMRKEHVFRSLRTGAQLFMVAQGLLAILAPRLALYLLYSPAVWIAAQLDLIPDMASDAQGTLVMTMICGLQAALMAYGIGVAAERLRSYVRYGRRRA